MRKQGLEVGVWFIVGLGAFVWWTTIRDDVGKLPSDEEQVVFQLEKDSRTGILYDVQITKCGRCKQTISWVRFRRGVPVGGYMRNQHECGKVRGKIEHFDGAKFLRDFSLSEALDRWQKKLSLP